MAADYTVTGVSRGEEQTAAGAWQPTIVVAYVTKTSPPISGEVTVPASLARDKVKYAAEVAAAIQAEVDGHKAVLAL